MLAYFGERISPHMVTTKEGFLICLDTPIARTGEMQYLAREMPDYLHIGGDPERPVTVTRDASEVFDPAAVASFEGKPTCDEHPPEDVTPENVAAYSKGHIQNVRRSGNQLIADLHITDPTLISEVKNGLKREISCGYECLLEEAGNGTYRQKQIRGNHVAVVPQGRAGPDVAIKDAAPAAKSERRPIMRDKKQGLFAMFGRAAKDATPEELDQLVQDASTMLDADPVKAPEAEPVKDAIPADPTASAAPNGLEAKIDKLIELMSGLVAAKNPAPVEDAPEAMLDKAISTLSADSEPKGADAPDEGEKAEIVEDSAEQPDQAVTDAAVQFLKSARPVIAAMKDPEEKKRVTDALLASIRPKTDEPGAQLLKAATSAAKKLTEDADPEARNKAQQAAYDARNPHRQKEDK